MSECDWAFLTDDRQRAAELDQFREFELRGPKNPELRELWDRCGEHVLREWTAVYPGTRPQSWWKFDAPRMAPGRWPGWFFDGKLPEPRRMLSGAGVPAWERYNLVPRYELGVPSCKWVDYDQNDPPTFESQAAYLRRHELLTPAERKQLSAKDYDRPEVIHYDQYWLERYKKLHAGSTVKQ
jgi:hypothetical protein